MQLPLRVAGETLMPPAIDEQAEQVILNCREILNAAGSDLSAVLNVTIFLADVSDWDAVNQVFAKAFAEHRPARGIVPVSALHLGARVAMQMIAAA